MSLRLKRILRGLRRSWTANAGLVIAGLGALQANSEILRGLLSPAVYGWLMVGIGIAVVVLRIKTTESVESKGAK